MSSEPTDWLDEARRRLNGSLLLCRESHFPDAVSRAFYATYAATQALLRSRGLVTNSHVAVKRHLSRLFVREHLLERVHLRNYDVLFNDRMAADYDAAAFTKAQALQCTEQARTFIKAAADLIPAT